MTRANPRDMGDTKTGWLNLGHGWPRSDCAVFDLCSNMHDCLSLKTARGDECRPGKTKAIEQRLACITSYALGRWSRQIKLAWLEAQGGRGRMGLDLGLAGKGNFKTQFLEARMAWQISMMRRVDNEAVAAFSQRRRNSRHRKRLGGDAGEEYDEAEDDEYDGKE